MRPYELGRGRGYELGFGMRAVQHLRLHFIGVQAWRARRITGSMAAARILTWDRVSVGHIMRRETTDAHVPPVNETRVQGPDVRQREGEESCRVGGYWDGWLGRPSGLRCVRAGAVKLGWGKE